MMRRTSSRCVRLVAVLCALTLVLALASMPLCAFAEDAATGESSTSTSAGPDGEVRTDEQGAQNTSSTGAEAEGTAADSDAGKVEGDPSNRNSINFQQLPDSSFIYDASIKDLAQASSVYDNQTVQVTGEAVGESILANFENDHRWVVVEDADGNSVSVYMTKTQTIAIDSFGKYGTVGTTIRVRGTYHLACPEHEGLSDVHAESVDVVKAGTVTTDNFDIEAFLPGICLVAVGVILFFLYNFLRERQR